MTRFILFLLLPFGLLAQSGPVCTQKGSLTTATVFTPLPNNTGNPNCNAFALTWNSTGFSAVTMQLQGADTIGGTYTAFTATTPFANPQAGLSGTIIVQGVTKIAFLQVNATVATGTGAINFQLYGYQGVTPLAGGGGGAACGTLGGDVTGTCAANTVVKIENGVIPTSAVAVGTNASKQLVARAASSTDGSLKLTSFAGSSPVDGNCGQWLNGDLEDSLSGCGVPLQLWTAGGSITHSTLVCLSSNTVVECPTITGAGAPSVLGLAKNSGAVSTSISVLTTPGSVQPCVFDNTAVVNDIVTTSGSVVGDCSDSGVVTPGALGILSPYVGIVLTAGTGTQSIMYVGPGANGAQQVTTTLTSHTISSPLGCVAASASGTAYTCTTSPSFVPAAGDLVYLKADVANTGSATLAVNGASAAVIKKNAGTTNLAATDLAIGTWSGMTFDGTTWQMQGEAGTAGSGGTCLALGGDVTGTCAANSVVKINGGSVPASAHGISTNSSSQPTASTAHDTSVPLQCSAAGASGTAYTCSTSPTFVPAAKDLILFCPDVANTGAATLVVNGQAGTPAIQKQQGQAALVANDLRASPACVTMEFDGSNWQMQGQSGNAATSAVTSVGGLTGTVPGGWILLEQHTATAGVSTELDFTTCVSSSYDQYAVTISNFITSTNAAYFQFQLSSNGGSSYDSANNYQFATFVFPLVNSSTSAIDSSSSTSGFPLAVLITHGLLSTATPSLTLTGYLYGMNTTSDFVYFTGDGIAVYDQNSNPYRISTGAQYKVKTSAINAFRLAPTSGTFSGGTARCYGVAKQ